MSKMYLTQAEADAKGLPSVQEQIDRHNAAVRAAIESWKKRNNWPEDAA